MSGLDILRSRVTFRDRPLVDVLDLALRFVVVQGSAYTKVALVVLVPALAVTLVVARHDGWPWAWVSALVLGLFAEVPFTILASRLVFQDEVRVKDVVVASFRALPRVLAMRFLWALTIVASAFMLLMPALWVGASLVFASEVLLLEHAGVVSSLLRSLRISTSSLGATIAGALLLAVFTALAVPLADISGRTIIDDLLQFRPPASAFDEGGSVLAMLGWFGALPYLTTARFFLYLNVRTRDEGWDIQTRFATIAARADHEGMRS
ncbi:MAG: hypothetical protein FWD69_01670 [Polyangiaceae bacterium]|nr:hypothetical protein [Polyangiaceae bacterium]